MQIIAYDLLMTNYGTDIHLTPSKHQRRVTTSKTESHKQKLCHTHTKKKNFNDDIIICSLTGLDEHASRVTVSRIGWKV